MNKTERNMPSVIIFISIILIIAVGGYFLISNNEGISFTEDKNEVKSIKIEEDKDYIYFTNEEALSKRESLNYKDIVININSDDAKKLADELNKNMSSIRNNYSKISEQSDLNVPKELLQDDVYEAKMIDYEVIKADKYLTLQVNNYLYRFEEGALESNLKYYVFDLENGELLSNKDILIKENISDQQVRSKIRSSISNDDTVDIDATLAGEYYLTINSNNKVVVNVLVKTSESDYMIDIEM